MNNYQDKWAALGIASRAVDEPPLPSLEGFKARAVVKPVRAIPSPTAQAIQTARVEAGIQQRTPSKSAADAREEAVKQVVEALNPAIDQHGGLILRVREPGGRLTILDAGSSAAEEHIALRVYKTTGKVPNADQPRKVLSVTRAEARQSGEHVHVNNRIARIDDGYCVDRGDASGSGWGVGAGAVQQIRDGDAAFRRGQGYGEHPEAIVPNTAREAWAELFGWFRTKGLSDDDATAVAVLLVEWLRCDTPQPVLEITGSAGTGKTTFARQLAALVDPRTGGTATIRLNREDIAAQVVNSYVLYCDNVSVLSAEEQDLACMVATGATLSARRLYAQGETFSVSVQNPLILTSIVPALTRVDARTRVLPVHLPERREHRSDVTIAREFEVQRPPLVGALLRLLAAALDTLPEAEAARRYTNRLASFEMLGEAILCAVARSMQEATYAWGTFGGILERKRQNSAAEASAGVPVIEAVRQLIDGARRNSPAIRTVPPAPRMWLARKQYEYIDADGVLHVGALLPVLLSKVHNQHGGAHGVVTNERALRNALGIWEATFNDLGIHMAFGKTEAGVYVEFITAGEMS